MKNSRNFPVDSLWLLNWEECGSGTGILEKLTTGGSGRSGRIQEEVVAEGVAEK